eukprot:9477880-Pyramimonas_sp.AAC.2
MAASRKPPGAQWQLWRPARLRWCREQLQKQRLQPAVQRALHSAWWLGQDVAGYFAERSGEYASVEQTDTVDGPQDDLPERAPAPKRRRLGPRAAQGEGVQHCASRAMCDARRLLVCYTYGLAQARSRAAKSLWMWGKRRESSTLSRWRTSGGGVSTGERPWFHMFDVMCADARDVDDWWRVCDFAFSTFVHCARDYLTHCRLGSAFDSFIPTPRS